MRKDIRTKDDVMKYGEMIRIARKKLKLSQANLSCQGLSKNLIGAVEQGTHKLTVMKGTIIYERLLEISLESQIIIELQFDELLEGQPRYIHIRNTYDYCKHLLKAILSRQVVSFKNIDDHLRNITMHNTGIFKYFAFLYTGMYMKRYNKKKSLHYYFESLECLKWLYPLEKEALFSRALREATPMAYELQAFSKLTEYQALNIKQMEQNNKTFSYNYYYNLAYFSLKAGEYEKANEAISSYMTFKLLNQEDLIDAKIIQAESLYGLGEYREAIEVLQYALKIINRSLHYDHKVTCLSKLICYLSFDEGSSSTLIHDYCHELDNIKDRVTIDFDLKECYHALSLGYYQLEAYDVAYEYFTILCKNNPLSFKEFKGHLPLLTITNNIQVLIELLKSINTTQLDKKNYIHYLELYLACKKIT